MKKVIYIIICFVLFSILWLPSAYIYATEESSDQSDASDLFVGTWLFEDTFDNPFKDSDGNTFTETWKTASFLRIEMGGTFQYELLTEGKKTGISQTVSLAGTWTASGNNITLVFSDGESGIGSYNEKEQFILLNGVQWHRLGASNPEEVLSEADTAEDKEMYEDETVDEEQDDFESSDLNDLSDQIGFFITKYGTDDLDFNLWASKWEGWDKLSQTQKTNLVKIIRRLDTILALKAPLSPMALAALQGEKRQEVLAQQAADIVQDELDIRKTVRDTVWTETLRDKFGDKGVYIYQNYQIFKDVKKIYDSGIKWINNIKDPDAAATEKIKQESLGGSKNPQDIANDAISHINTIATASSVYHYAYYREVYDKIISGGKTIDEAHQAALDALRERVKDYNDGKYGNFEDKLQQRVWGPAVESALKPGGVYDNAFRKLVEIDLACPKV